MDQEDSAGLQNSPGKAQIGFARAWISRGVIMDHDERISGVRDHRLKDFSWVREGLVDRPLTNRADLNEVLLGVKKNNAQGLTIEKTHFGTEIGVIGPRSNCILQKQEGNYLAADSIKHWLYAKKQEGGVRMKFAQVLVCVAPKKL